MGITLTRQFGRRKAILRRVACAMTVSALVGACASNVRSTQLRPEEALVLRVGQRASLVLPSEAGFSIGQAGSALSLIKQEQRGSQTVFVYLAGRVGKHTFVATPKAPGPDGCVSCVTEHYFVTVIE